MLVSFYAQISIVGMSLLVILVPFLGFPQAWDNALTAILGAQIFGVGIHALYTGYVRILKREERRSRDQEAKNEENIEKKKIKKNIEEKVFEEGRHTKEEKRGDYNVLEVVRD